MANSKNYEIITNQIVEALEQVEANDWECPWNRFSQIPRNADSGRRYNGVNVLVLWSVAMSRGYETQDWFTYKGAQRNGGQVKKGEKGTKIVYWRFIKKPDLRAAGLTQEEYDDLSKAEQEDVPEKSFPLCKTFSVFNRAQCDGLPKPEKTEVKGDEEIDEFIDSIGADIRRGPMAAYSPKEDKVMLPPRSDFKSSNSFYATAFHELAHWTGHESRLDRDMSTRFGDESYAFEELIAQLATSFVCADFGIKSDIQSAEYIKSWISKMKEDEYAVFTASREAKEAAEFLHEAAEAKDAEVEVAA